MTRSDSELKRGMAIFFLLDSAKSISHRQAAELLSCTEQDVTKALDEIALGYVPIDEHVEQQDSFSQLTGSRKRPLPRLNERETKTLVNVLGTQGISPEEEPFASLFCEHGALDAAGNPLAHADAKATTRDNAAAMREVAQACEDKDAGLAIDYLKDGADEARRYRVHNVSLSSKSGVRYLHAQLSDGAERSFRTDRIVSARRLDAAAPSTARAQDDAEPSSSQTARLLFLPDAPDVEWPGLRTRKGGHHADGSIERTVPWYGSEWLPQRLAASGGTIVPLAPDKLIDMTRDYAERLLGELDKS